MEKKDLKILLGQFRKDPIIMNHERDCFAKSMGLDQKQFYQVDFLSDIKEKINVKNYDAIILGGSGAFNINEYVEKYSVNLKIIKKLILQTKENQIPMLAVCFGQHLDAYLFGGEVVNDQDQSEVGTFSIKITSDGQKDPLLKNLPNNFFTQNGHHCSVSVPPKNTKILAYSKKCKVQVYSYKNYPGFYSIQFHPELNKKEVSFRIDYYSSQGYTESVENLKESPLAFKVAENFVNEVILK